MYPAPKAVVEISAAAGAQTPLRTAETCSTSTVDLCPDAAVNVTEKADDDRANFFRAMCDELPRNASIPLPISVTDILDLHQYECFQGPDGRRELSCAFPWTHKVWCKEEPAQT